MITYVTPILASFLNPVNLGTTPQSLLLALPLIAVIAVVYKATKMEEFTCASFVKEAAILFGSISVFMVLAAIGLYLVMRFTVG